VDGTVGGEPADGGWRRGWLYSAVDIATDKSGRRGADAETECGDDSVVEDVAYVGLAG